MMILGKYDIKPGEIWAVTGSDPTERGMWCARIAQDEEIADATALLSFAQHAEEAQKTGWPQARYYGEEGQTVAEFLSFNAVYEVIPFAIGVRYPETRKAYRQRLAFIVRLLNLQKLKDHQVIALSNGETRRVLLARALAKKPKLLVLDDPTAGLDTHQCAKLRDVVAALAKRGLSIIFAYRHMDELPSGVTKWLTVGKDGKASERKAPPSRPNRQTQPRASRNRHPTAKQNAAPPVVEINDLNVTLGGKVLFRHLSWTVRKGERWILRGENGSGKTTLLALITGDSPLAYAADIKVFGIPRETGTELARIRRRIGMDSPEMQAYLGFNPDELLDRALCAKHDLLLLDEPFMNLDARTAQKAARRIESHLRTHPEVTAILICHRADEVPALFTHEFNLDANIQQVRPRRRLCQ